MFVRFIVLAMLVMTVAACGPTTAQQNDALREENAELRYALRQANERIAQTAADIESNRGCHIDPPEPVQTP